MAKYSREFLSLTVHWSLVAIAFAGNLPSKALKVATNHSLCSGGQNFPVAVPKTNNESISPGFTLHVHCISVLKKRPRLPRFTVF